MNLTRLISHQSLVTKPSVELVNLAAILNISIEINLLDDHAYIVSSTGELFIASFFQRRADDEYIPTEVFCEILMDIKGGLTVLEAYKKQGYTY